MLLVRRGSVFEVIYFWAFLSVRGMSCYVDDLIVPLGTDAKGAQLHHAMGHGEGLHLIMHRSASFYKLL